MRSIGWVLCMAVLVVGCRQPQVTPETIDHIAREYIAKWIDFYPSAALFAGRTASAEDFEDMSPTSIEAWVGVNQRIRSRLALLPEDCPLRERIDRSLLERQVQLELFTWEESAAHTVDPLLYSRLINHSLSPVLVRQNLSAEQKTAAITARLAGLRQLCSEARENLVDGRPAAIVSASENIAATADFVETALADGLENPGPGVREDGRATAQSLRVLSAWLVDELKPTSTLDDSHGEQLYSRELGLTYGAAMQPERLLAMATEEIAIVRQLMADIAERYWREHRTEESPADFDELIRPALEDMERAHAADQEEFLADFLDLIDRSERFVEEHDLADLPQHRSLYTALSPAHFAGASVGGVYSAGPFDPEAETLFYLPTVPDSAATEVKEGFYRSFNDAFNSMIITHEIYPGHYLQLKMAAAHPSQLRPLFAGNDFTEGWASYCEQMMLDAGWDEGVLLTRLAHLRKRLENAVRAVVSVRVHCFGWSRDEVQFFAVETGLLPPQFAENLWDRALFSPIQLPSYFIGFGRFAELYADQRASRGDEFSVKALNMAILESGGLPLDDLHEYAESQL